MTKTTSRLARTALAVLLCAGAATEALARLPHAPAASSRVEAAPQGRFETGRDEVRTSVAYAAPVTPALRPVEAPTTRETVPAPAETGAASPAPRKSCPARSWPNLAPRCFADLGGRS